MDDQELQQMLDDVTHMVNNLMCVNLETWIVKRAELEQVCKASDERGLMILHEDVAVRLMSAMN